MGVSFESRCPWRAPSLEHRLDQQCTPACPIADLHADTLEILKAYPALGWYGQPFYGRGKTFYEREKNEKAIHIVAQDQSPCSAFKAKLFDSFLLEITQDLFAIEEPKNDRKIYLPEAMGGLSKPDGIAIARWNDRVLQRAFKATGLGKDIQIPLLAIQVIWLHDKLNPTQVKSEVEAEEVDVKEGENENYRLVSLGPLKAALGGTGVPAELLDRFCYHWNYDVQTVAAINRACPEEGKVAVALLHARGLDFLRR
jgi:hypothetical protein